MSRLFASELFIHGPVKGLADEQFGKHFLEFLCRFSKPGFIQVTRWPRVPELGAEVRVINAFLGENSFKGFAVHFYLLPVQPQEHGLDAVQ